MTEAKGAREFVAAYERIQEKLAALYKEQRESRARIIAIQRARPYEYAKWEDHRAEHDRYTRIINQAFRAGFVRETLRFLRDGASYHGGGEGHFLVSRYMAETVPSTSARMKGEETRFIAYEPLQGAPEPASAALYPCPDCKTPAYVVGHNFSGSTYDNIEHVSVVEVLCLQCLESHCLFCGSYNTNFPEDWPTLLSYNAQVESWLKGQ